MSATGTPVQNSAGSYVITDPNLRGVTCGDIYVYIRVNYFIHSDNSTVISRFL